MQGSAIHSDIKETCGTIYHDPSTAVKQAKHSPHNIAASQQVVIQCFQAIRAIECRERHHPCVVSCTVDRECVGNVKEVCAC